MIFPWQKTQWHKLTRLFDSGRLPHAMLLLGNQGLGKTEFATSLAHAVLCQQARAGAEGLYAIPAEALAAG